MLQSQCRTQDTQAATLQGALAERRQASRVPVIKSAKLVVHEGGGQGVYNCLVLDESPTGVLVDLGAMFELPEEMVLHVGGGTTYRARRRWAVGTKAGLEFIGAQIVTEKAAAKMRALGAMLAARGLPATMAALRAERFFDNEELRHAAEEAEAAQHRLEAILGGGSSI